jgi:hypothetical protein
LEDGLNFSEIQARTGFGDKTIRNVLYRLNRKGAIERKSWGVYIVG